MKHSEGYNWREAESLAFYPDLNQAAVCLWDTLPFLQNLIYHVNDVSVCKVRIMDAVCLVFLPHKQASLVVFTMCILCAGTLLGCVYVQKNPHVSLASQEPLSTWNQSVVLGFMCRSPRTGVSRGTEPRCVTAPQSSQFLPGLLATAQQGGQSWAPEVWRATDLRAFHRGSRPPAAQSCE